MHSIYIDTKFNENRIIKILGNYSEDDISKFQNFTLRLKKILDTTSSIRGKVLMDAEQTYLQSGIDDIVEQYQFKYNK